MMIATLKCPLCGTKTERAMPTTQPYCDRPTCGTPLIFCYPNGCADVYEYIDWSLISYGLIVFAIGITLGVIGGKLLR